MGILNIKNMEKTIEYPIIICDNSPFIKVNCNKEDIWFMIDSGCQGCVLDINYVSVPLEQLKEETLTGVGENSNKGYEVLMSFSIGNEDFYCSSTALDLGTTFDKFTKRIRKIVGLLGGEFLYNYKMILDYKTSTLKALKEDIDAYNDIILKKPV